MAHSDTRMLSQPCKVYFAGFESDTYRLQQAGWKLAAHEEIREGRMHLAATQEQSGVTLLCRDIRFNFMDQDRYSSWGHRSTPEFHVSSVINRATTIMMHGHVDFSGFRPIDAEPQMTQSKVMSFKDLAFFATPLVRTEEIIIEPQSVAECLDLIRKMQAPELAAIRKRNMERDRAEPMNQHKFHAQILSMAA